MVYASNAAFGTSADDQVHELATILASGIGRLKSRQRLATEISVELSESGADGLEFTPANRLSVSHG